MDSFCRTKLQVSTYTGSLWFRDRTRKMRTISRVGRLSIVRRPVRAPNRVSVTANPELEIPSLPSLSPPNFRLDPLPMLSLGSEGIPMHVSPAQPRFPPPHPHRHRRAYGWRGGTASLPVEAT